MQLPALLILCGLPFAGKTSLAEEIVETFDITRISIDDINQERGIWDDLTGMSAEDWTNTYNIAYQRIDSLLSKGKNVIDDSVNYSFLLRERVRNIAQAHGASSIVIYVDTPLSEVQRRWRHNRRRPTRNDLRDEDFMFVVDSFEPPLEEQFIRYDGSIAACQWIEENISHVLRSSN